MARLYRYVEEAEWVDIAECGVLRPGFNSCGPGKWVARTESDAWRWGEALDDGFPTRVVVLELDDEIVERAYIVDNLDGIGPGAYFEGDDLTRIRIVEAVEHQS